MNYDDFVAAVVNEIARMTGERPSAKAVDRLLQTHEAWLDGEVPEEFANAVVDSGLRRLTERGC